MVLESSEAPVNRRPNEGLHTHSARWNDHTLGIPDGAGLAPSTATHRRGIITLGPI